MADLILPYKNLGEAIGLSLDLGGIPHKTFGEHSILVDASQAGKNITINIEAQLPSGIADMFPKPERKNPPLEVLGTIVSIDAGIRRTIPLQRRKPNLYSGKVMLNLGEITESARLCVFALKKSDGSAAGFAKHNGSRLAWSPTHEIRFNERPTKGQFLQILWEDFGNSAVVPANFEEAFYYVDSQSEPPALYLNSLMGNELKSLVTTEVHGGSKALPRDVTFCSIATSAYLTLAQEMLKQLHEEASVGGTPVDPDAAFSGSWKLEMFELLAPLLNPTILPDSAKLELCTKIDDGKYYGQVLSRTQLAIQSYLLVREHYEKLAEKAFENG